MIGGLLRRALRESGPATLGFGVALLILETFLAYVLPTYAGEFEDALLKISFVRDFLGALLGTRIEEGFAASIAQGLPWVHPAVLVVAWGHELVFCTRVPVGEIDRGTVDLLLTLPVSRWQLWRAETVAWLISGGFLLILGFTGFTLGTLAAGGEFPPAGRLTAMLVNAGCLYFAIGCLTYLLSALTERRGRALGAALAILLASFLINFLAELWTPARPFGFLSFLDYYRPLDVLRSDAWPLGNMAVLVGAGVIAWVAGGVIFARRDIHVT